MTLRASAVGAAGLLTIGILTSAQQAQADPSVDCGNMPRYQAVCNLYYASTGEVWKVNGTPYPAGNGKYRIIFGCGTPNATYRVDVSYYDSTGVYHSDDAAAGYCTSVNQ